MERGMEHGMERGTDVKCHNESNKHVNWSWRQLISRSRVTRVLVTIISRELERAQPRRLATRDYRQVVCPGCEKFTVDKMLVDTTIQIMSQSVLRAQALASLPD